MSGAKELKAQLEEWGGLGQLTEQLEEWGGLREQTSQCDEGRGLRVATRRKASNRRTPQLGVSFRERNEVDEARFSMQTWGVDRLEHGLFWNNIIKTTTDSISGRGVSALFDSNRTSPKHLPTDPIEAIRTVCTKEIDIMATTGSSDDNTLVVVHDRIEERFPHLSGERPWRWNVDTHRYELRQEFKRCTQIERDPLLRFCSFRMDAEELVREQHVQSGKKSCIQSCSAHIVRAMLLHSACSCSTGIQCVGCGAMNSLRWNAHHNTYWRRMECIKCGALYEIKTTGLLSKALKKNRVDGGRFFSQYHNIRRERQDRKIFLALIDSWCLRMDRVRVNVYVGEVERVLPFLKPKSFLKSTIPRIYTSIDLKWTRPWFSMAKSMDLNSVQKFFGQIIDSYFAAKRPVCSIESGLSSVTRTENHCEEQKPEESRTTRNLSDDELMEQGSRSMRNFSDDQLIEQHRTLRRKRARIAVLKKKALDKRSKEELKLLEEEDEALAELTAFEAQMEKRGLR